MNDFDRFLEMKLRHLLDPVVAGQPPARRARRQKPILAVQRIGFSLAAEAIPVEPVVVVTRPVAAAHQI